MLCQQDLQEEASTRLDHFEEFVRSSTQQDLDQAKSDLAEKIERLQSLAFIDDSINELVEELRLESEDLASSIGEEFIAAEARRDRALAALADEKPMPSDFPTHKSNARAVNELVNELQQRSQQVLGESKDGVQEELRELKARETLGKHLPEVIDEIEKLKQLAAYQLCLNDTNTAAITRKSSDVTKRVVTSQLADSFTSELEKLGFTHVEVELQAAGGERGALYHQLILKRAPGIELPRVVSEGEASTLSIAAFFAELSTSESDSAILFDDPVSSMDHMWREHVAHRLAIEAKDRQVVVFTHDIVFLLALARFAQEVGAELHNQCLRRGPGGAGVSAPDLPWVAMKVRNRIGVLKNRWQEAEKLHRTAAATEYESAAKDIYGLLRESWERGIEEVLLEGIVERYRPNIQTQQVKVIADITEDDCNAIEAGITKSSRWLVGHDLAPAENAPVPDPDELEQDILALADWVGSIRKRRN